MTNNPKKLNKTKELNKRDVAVFISEPPEVIGELERTYDRPMKQGMWVLTKEAIEKYCLQPALKGKGKGDRYLTLNALQKLFPEVNCNKVYYKGVVLNCYEENGQIVFDKLTPTKEDKE
jgi:hypothetical protein